MDAGVLHSPSIHLKALLRSALEQMASHRLFSQKSTSMGVNLAQSNDLELRFAASQYLLRAAGDNPDYLSPAFQHLRPLAESDQYKQGLVTAILECASQISRKSAEELLSISPSVQILIKRLAIWEGQHTEKLSGSCNLQDLFQGLSQQVSIPQAVEDAACMGLRVSFKEMRSVFSHQGDLVLDHRT